MVKTPRQTVGGTMAETRRPSNPQQASRTFCILCRESYDTDNAQEHVHGMLHHRELEIVLGRDSPHECLACKESSMSLSEYAQHISTTQHKSNLSNLILSSVKPVSLHKTLGKEIFNKISERNKNLKRARKMENKKEQRRMKWQADQKRIQMRHKMSKQTPGASRQKQSKQVNRMASKMQRQTEHRGNGQAIVNKENRLRVGFGWLPQSQCDKQPWFHKVYHNLSVNSNMFDFDKRFNQGHFGYCQTDRLDKTPWDAQGSGSNAPQNSARSNVNQHEEYYYWHQNDVTDQELLNDELPKNGAISFDKQDKSKGYSQACPGQSPHCSNTTNSASTSKCMDLSKDFEPIRDADINAMLWQIRRTLGVREPCRADRVARSQRQSNKTDASEGEHGAEQQRTLGLREPYTADHVAQSQMLSNETGAGEGEHGTEKQRTLGVREPCKVDRVARNQRLSNKAGAGEGKHGTEQQRKLGVRVPCIADRVARSQRLNIKTAASEGKHGSEQQRKLGVRVPCIADCVARSQRLSIKTGAGEGKHGTEQQRKLGVRAPCIADRVARSQRLSIKTGAGEGKHGTEQQRKLGVRTPCIADRVARSQRLSNKTGAGEGKLGTEQQRTERHLPFRRSLGNKHSDRAASPHIISRAASDQSSKTIEQGVFRMAVEDKQQSTGRSEISCNLDTQKNAKDGESQAGSTSSKVGSLVLPASLNRCMGKTTSAEPNLNTARRIRNVSDSRKADGEKEAGFKPTLQKLINLSAPQRKVNWREMYQEVKKKRREKVKGMPRFGIELINPQSERDDPPEDEDLPLSEGFHWESAFPDNSPPAPCPPAPPPQDTTANDSIPERQSASRTQEHFELPAKALEDDKNMLVIPTVSIKVEPDFEESRNGTGGNTNGPKKRKSKEDDGISKVEPSGKKKKSKKDQTQVDQLLAVSLREEELSQSLKDLDGNLILTRNALQAAYNEVQRLLLLRQQFIAEVNSLRAKRIEILQGMQDGFSGTSGLAQEAGALAAVAVAATSPRSPSLPSSSCYTTPSLAAASDASTSLNTFPTNKPIKQEPLEQFPGEQAHQPAKMPPCTNAAPKIPSSGVLPLLSSVLLPSLLLTPSNPVSTSPKPEVGADGSTSSIKQFEQQMRERLKDGEKNVVVKEKGIMSLKEEVQPTDRYPEAEQGGHPSAEQVRVRGRAATILAPEKGQEEPVAAQDSARGSESDSSIEMMEPSSRSIQTIDIEESDKEGLPEPVSNIAIPPELVQTSVCVDFNSTCSQTVKFEKDDPCRKILCPTISNKVSKIDPESVADVEPSLGAFQDHEGPVHGMQVHNGLLYTCSADTTARAYCLVSRECKAVFEGHTNKVNCLLVSSPPQMPARLYTGSSDKTIRCYSIKSSKCLEQISLPDKVLCLHIAWNILYAGLANGSVVSFDLKTQKQLDVFECHNPRGVSCLGTAQEGARRILLVGSYDSTISVRDAKSGLLLRSLKGHTKTVLCMTTVNDLVFSGSSDLSVYAHNIHTGELMRIYKGYGHTVTSIAVLGKVMVTASLDKLVHVCDLQIYTGCCDGSIQAVKLNLMKNYRCWWHGCTLVFGMMEHLLHHLVGDHTNLNLQTVRCRWRGCSDYFATQDSVKQAGLVSARLGHTAEKGFLINRFGIGRSSFHLPHGEKDLDARGESQCQRCLQQSVSVKNKSL
ncbi:zinc finger protein 106 isoform X2 [Lampris incognitus]|uniref:zinc finger protein 106 isoform X2 n=1 Tax=Lampris incognitus TaxID=2546036 RepID=UPI0024B5448E|nr:zinc finger protein 106 isoform X2 [Lampris incognitus]